MGIFTGTYDCKVDDKGRVSLPADFRDVLPDFDSRAIYLFPSPNYQAIEACDRLYIERIADSIERTTDIFSEAEDELANIIAMARRTSIDKTGRFILNADLLSYADIDQNAAFVGRARRFQIWQPELYDTHRQKARGKHISLKLAPLENPTHHEQQG